MKKTLALAIALVMLCVCAFSVAAAETTLPDSDGTAWWVNHTQGIEVTEEGVEITFTNTTYETATGNWNGPLYVLYTSEDATISRPNADPNLNYDAPGYVEYWVTRGDAYGWGNAVYYGVTGDLNTDVNNATAVANMAAAGITFSSTGVEGWVGWDNFVTALKAGAEGKVTAQLVDGKANIVIEINGLQSTLVAPVDTSKPVYISLFAELATLTNIKVTTPDPVCEHTNTEVKDAKEASCTEAGYTGDTYCLDCGEKLEDGSEIAVLEHVYADGACTACGAADPDYQPETQPTEPEQGGDSAGTGDMFGIVVAVMAASGIALVALKKED